MVTLKQRELWPGLKREAFTASLPPLAEMPDHCAAPPFRPPQPSARFRQKILPCCSRRRDLYARPLSLADFNQTRVARRLHRIIRDELGYDQALVDKTGWKLEYLWSETGCPYYKVSHRANMMGVVIVRTDTRLQQLQQRLAHYLLAQGFRLDRMQITTRQSKLSEKNNKLPALFTPLREQSVARWPVKKLSKKRCKR